MSGHHKWSEIKRKKDSNMSEALKWARNRGLNHEQDLMAETLRQLCHISIILSVGLGSFIAIGLALVFK
jgi:hypothetical protein